METPVLGNLAYAVLEQHGAAAAAAVAGILARAWLAVPRDRAPHLIGGVYSDRQAARQSLLRGNWVTLGEIATTAGVTLVDVNVTTGAIRERCVWRGCGYAECRPVPVHPAHGACGQAS